MLSTHNRGQYNDHSPDCKDEDKNLHIIPFSLIKTWQVLYWSLYPLSEGTFNPSSEKLEHAVMT